jgi:hypothetical protein
MANRPRSLGPPHRGTKAGQSNKSGRRNGHDAATRCAVPATRQNKPRWRLRGQPGRNLRCPLKNLTPGLGCLVRKAGAHCADSFHATLPPLRAAPVRTIDACGSTALICAARKCIRSTIIPNLIRSSSKRDMKPTRPSQKRYLGENGCRSGKAISKAISSSLRMASTTVAASPECTTAKCRLMLSVQTWSDPGAWVPNFNRDGKFTSRSNRLSQF